MEAVIFGKRQGFAYKPGEPLAKRIVPAFDVGGCSRTYWCFRKQTLVGIAECSPRPNRRRPYIGKRPQFVQLQRVFRLGRRQCGFQGRQITDFYLVPFGY